MRAGAAPHVDDVEHAEWCRPSADAMTGYQYEDVRMEAWTTDLTDNATGLRTGERMRTVRCIDCGEMAHARLPSVPVRP